MPLANWNDQKQQRAAAADRTLRTSVAGLAKALQAAIAVRAQFIALGLNGLWPRDALNALEPAEYVHLAPDASTQQEQQDMGQLIVYLRGHLLDEGTDATTATQARTALTPAQARAIALKYLG